MDRRTSRSIPLLAMALVSRALGGPAPADHDNIEAARELGVSLNRLNEIVRGKRGIMADTALRLARFLKTSPQLWMRLQSDWNLHQAMRREARRAS